MKKNYLGCALAFLLLFAVRLPSGAAPDEYRAFWVDAWGAGLLNQTQVTKLLGTPGDPNSKGDLREANANAVFVQARRRADVNYPSGMGEPYHSGLSPSNFNALQAIIDAAHCTAGDKQRIEVHAWLVVFLTAEGAVYHQHNDPSDPDNYWVTLDHQGNEPGTKAFDPGHPKCLNYTVNVFMDVVRNFDVDGIHYDYIRFTGSNLGYNPTSVARYNARYGLSGTPSSSNEQWRQWRRDQNTALVRQVYARVQAEKPSVKVSGSYVTWNPSPTSSTRSAFQATRPYYDVFSDWDSWQQEGLVDISVPMVYYNQASLPNDYTRWMNFIKDRKFNRHAIIGPGIYLNSLNNAILQLQMTRDQSPAGNYAHGFSGYSYRAPFRISSSPLVYGSWDDFSPQLVSNVTPAKANIPPMPWKENPTKGHISGTVYTPGGVWADGATVTITGPENRTMICDGTGFYAFIDLPPGIYTVTASMTGYPSKQEVVSVAIGDVTGNMYVTDFNMGEVGTTVISNVSANDITDTSAVITWNTDQAASSQVEYGLTSQYGSTTPVIPGPVTSHMVNLSGLSSLTTYHYRVISANENGTATSADYTFTTSGPPVISNVQASDVASTSAVITWNTNVQATSRVDYGVSTAYGESESDMTLKTSHSITLTELTPETIYNYQCISTNPYGTTQSSNFTFTTTALPLEIIIDNNDPEWANTSPGSNTWTVGSIADVPKIGDDYLYYRGDGSLTESSVTRKCTWTPNLPIDGLYDVYVFYQMGTNRNTAAPYKVYYDGGQLTSIENQYSDIANQGGWFLIGEDLPFKAGTSGYVELTTLSLDTNLVSADAAKWVLKSILDDTPPIMLSVNDEEYTFSATTLEASWEGVDPESGIARYDYGVGSMPGIVDVKGWTDAGTATSAIISGLDLSPGATYFIMVRAVNGAGLVSEAMSSDGVTVAHPVTSLAHLKYLPDGYPVGLGEYSVSAVYPGAFYMQDEDRTSGIRVESSAQVAVNQLVQVFGTMETVNGAERALLNCKITPGATGSDVKPLFMNIRSVGGTSPSEHTLEITDGVGLYNIGLLAQVAGEVTELAADGFYLDDGNGLQGEDGRIGIKIWTGATSQPEQYSFVMVTGAISSILGADSNIYPQILARDITDY